jgi:hypothetical protein
MLTVNAATMVMMCWGGPCHANRECCDVLAILLRVVMVLECGCRPRRADRECCAVLTVLLLAMRGVSASATLVKLTMSATPWWRCY